MLRHLFTVVSAVSIVLCVTTIGLWVRSLVAEDLVVRESVTVVGETAAVAPQPTLRWTDQTWVHSLRGSVWVYRAAMHFADPSYEPAVPPVAERPVTGRPTAVHWAWDATAASDGHPDLLRGRMPPGYGSGGSLLGLSWRHDATVNEPGSIELLVSVPLWWPFVLTVVAPTVWVIRWGRRRRRTRRNQCLACGYDLRATPERCPECGAASDEASA